MKWLFYVLVLLYMFYRAVYGVKAKETGSLSGGLSIEPIEYDGDKNFLVPGVRKTISCKGTNRNQKLEWFNRAGDPVSKVSTNSISVQEHFVSLFRGRTRIPVLVLIFSSITVDDSGVWECRAGETKQTVSLCVIDPSHFVDTTTEVSVDRGRSITLSCQARGDPEPRVQWYRYGEIMSDNENNSKYIVMTKYNSEGFEGLLTITSLEPEDSGVYTCNAIQESPFVDNCSHTEIINITLQVNHAPIFEDENGTVIVYGVEGESVDLVCSASGYPKPTYRWFQQTDDFLLEAPEDKIQLHNDGSDAILSLVLNASSFGNRYKCRASNRYGDVDNIFIILETKEPATPTEVEIHSNGWDIIQFRVIWNNGMSFPVYGFDVQYNKLQNQQHLNWKDSKLIHLKPNQESGSGYSEVNGNKVLYVTLPNLNEDTDYVIRLRAVNTVGVSAWSSTISASTVGKTKVTVELQRTEGTTTPRPAKDDSDSTFYGIFFAGGIVVMAVVFMFVMRMV